MTARSTVSIKDVISALDNVKSFLDANKSKIRNMFSLTSEIQCPQGSCSSVVIHVLGVLLTVIRNILLNHPELIKMTMKCMSTKPNENLFAQIHIQVLTPDVLEFARAFPGAVENLQMRIANSHLYSSQARTHITSDLNILQNTWYHSLHFHILRRNNHISYLLQMTK